MTNSGLPTLARTAAGRLRALVGRAGDPCCCNGGGAYRATECCDGVPEVWIEAGAALRCGGVGGVVRLRGGPEGTDGRCFTLTSDFATDEDVRRLGLVVWGGAAVECMTGCTDARCTVECPTGCCVFAWLPACTMDEPRRCCVLGSAYRLTYTQVYREVRTRPASQAYISIGGGCEEDCIFDPTVVTETREDRLEAEVVHAGEEPIFGENCSGILPFARTRVVRAERVWMTDGDDVDGCTVRARNGRYVETGSDVVNSVAVFARGELPAYLYPLDGDGNAMNACQSHAQIDECAIAFPEPCPNPSNPAQGVVRRRVIDVRGGAECNGGEQVVVEVETRSLCNRDLDGQAPTLALEVTRREWRRTWTVEILSWNGCETRTCPEDLPPPGPAPLRAPSAAVAQTGTRAKRCGGCGNKGGGGVGGGG
jgi:hypothetical protein